MNTEVAQFGKGLWVRWAVASAIGLFVGFAAYYLLVMSFVSEQGLVLKTLISAVGGVIFGGAVGGAQLFAILFFGSYSLITGGVLVRLLKQPGPVEPA